ncbi:MAG: diadenylate cyclase [Myxococcota bacterium]
MSEKKFSQEFLSAALSLANKKSVDKLLYVSDIPPPWEEVKKRRLKAKIVHATSNPSNVESTEKMGGVAVHIPTFVVSRVERIKLALASAISKGKIKNDDIVLCLTGKDESSPLDTIVSMVIGKEFDSRLDYKKLTEGGDTQPAILEGIIALAHKIGYEGYEGKPLGTILVVGDSVRVMENSRQITLNPFQGYPESERNIMDPTITDAIRSFSSIDGAFVIRGDGIVLAAGRYLVTPEGTDVEIPMGLGARHAAAALISRFTNAIAVVVSQTSGTVRVFHKGKIAIELKQEKRRS